MTTTIKSTDLDFNTIKNNLKMFLAEKPEFADYNFEGAGLSNILDVLAYNTHYNALTANFALNESFLSTAQLRSSLVSHASALGYTVGSKNAAFSIVTLSVFNTDSPSSMDMPAGFSFSTTIDNKSYTFKTRTALTALNDGANNYVFNLGGNTNVSLYEGVSKIKTYIAGASSENETYVIPVVDLDLDTVVVKVYDSVTSSDFTTYINLNNATSITSASNLYTIKETPNGYYEISFSNGVRLGTSPIIGNKIEVGYDITNGSEGNGGRNFTPNDTLDGKTVTAVTLVNSQSGGEKEDLESIRKNAPYMYATQNRMVTAQDYSALVLRNFSSVIADIKSWGGEDNIPPQYGAIFLSIKFSTEEASVITTTKSRIVELAKDLSVASFTIEYLDPITTFLETSTVVQWNPNLTSETSTGIQTKVKDTIKSYFDANLGLFNQSFRRSNLLTQIDDTDPSVLSSRSDIKMQHRLIPNGNVNETLYTITFPSSIAAADDQIYIIDSGVFRLAGESCKLRNRLNSNVIEVLNISTGNLQLDNIGSYDDVSGVLTLSGFDPAIISGSYIKITAVPANPATLTPLRNNVLEYDASSSNVTVVSVTV